MSDPSVRYVRRLIAEEENKGGMRVGTPQITIDTANAERVCRLADRLALIEAACLLRSEIDAPSHAFQWRKYVFGDGEVECRWVDSYGAHIRGLAPDFFPDSNRPSQLPIVEA